MKIGSFHFFHKLDAGKARAKVMRSHIFKMATKIGVLFQSNELTGDDFSPAQGPLMEVAAGLCEVLELPEPDRTQSEFSGVCLLGHDSFYPVISGHMKKSNADKLTELFEFYRDEEFLFALFHDPDYGTERVLIAESLTSLLEPFDEDLKASREFERDRLIQKRDNMEGLISQPQLTKYLKNQETAKLFKEWYCSQGMMGTSNGGKVAEEDGMPSHNRTEQHCHITFYNAVEDYKVTTSKSILATRAQTILDNFFSERGEHFFPIPPELSEPIRDMVDEGTCRKNLFHSVLVRIRPEFFLFSCYYLNLFLELHYGYHGGSFHWGVSHIRCNGAA